VATSDLEESFTFEKKQLKLQAMCAFRFICKTRRWHILHFPTYGS